VALIDLSPASSYLLGRPNRVRGGLQHTDYSFHGPAFSDFTVSGGRDQDPCNVRRTLAGPSSSSAPGPTHRCLPPGRPLRFGPATESCDDARPYADRSVEGWASYTFGSDVLVPQAGSRA